MEFYFDVVCPFAYVASTSVAALADEAGVSLTWKPVLLGGMLQTLGVPSDPNLHMAENRARLVALDMARAALRRGVPLHRPQAHPRRTVDAMRLLYAVAPEQIPALAAVLFRAYWVDGDDVADRAVLQRLVAPFSIDVAAVVADPRIREALRIASTEAATKGVFGVPSYRVNGSLHWGVDRVAFVRAALGLSPVASELGAPRGGTVEFFHDFSSPFSYLASTQIERVAAEAGASLVTTPFLLGALFQAIGTPTVPLFTFSEPRRAWVARDLDAWAERWGVPFRFPRAFPLRTLLPLRVALVEPAVTAPIYRAAWVDGQDIGAPDTLVGVLSDGGFDGAALVEAAARDDIKALLRRNTERAAATGVCGAPSFWVDDEVLFWGQDRLDEVARALRGWRPDA